MDSMFFTYLGWGVSLASGVFMYHYKSGQDRTKALEEARRATEAEHRISLENKVKELERKQGACEVASAVNENKIKDLQANFQDIKSQLSELFSKLENKIDSLSERINEALRRD